MRRLFFLAGILTVLVGLGCSTSKKVAAGTGKQTSAAGGGVKILQSWQGDYPVVKLNLLPVKQRSQGIGFINDAKIFADVWKAFKPREAVPEIDFKSNLVLFARNTQFYNRISIGRVNLKNGVAELLAMETMSALPIEDKVAMAMVLVAMKGIHGLKSGDGIIQVYNF